MESANCLLHMGTAVGLSHAKQAKLCLPIARWGFRGLFCSSSLILTSDLATNTRRHIEPFSYLTQAHISGRGSNEMKSVLRSPTDASSDVVLQCLLSVISNNTKLMSS